MGRIFDERGNRMTPTYAVKKGVRYRYYISAALIQGHADQAAKLNRVPAAEIETFRGRRGNRFNVLSPRSSAHEQVVDQPLSPMAFSVKRKTIGN